MSPLAPAPLSSSQEDYLEAVLDLVRTGRVARVRDIARRLNVGMPSVSVALRALRARGLVNYDPYQVITLTDRGQQLGEGVDRRHAALEDFLIRVLGVAPEAARSNACRMEHAIDDEVLKRLTHLGRFVRKCPRIGRAWSDPRKRRAAGRSLPLACRRCFPARPAAVAPSRAPTAGRARA
jgi:DtxR family Mn-dependent transcriptional regulator